MLAKRDRIREIAQSNNAARISLFGSVARGEDKFRSDCDFIVDVKPGTTLGLIYVTSQNAVVDSYEVASGNDTFHGCCYLLFYSCRRYGLSYLGRSFVLVDSGDGRQYWL